MQIWFHLIKQYVIGKKCWITEVFVIWFLNIYRNNDIKHWTIDTSVACKQQEKFESTLRILRYILNIIQFVMELSLCSTKKCNNYNLIMCFGIFHYIPWLLHKHNNITEEFLCYILFWHNAIVSCMSA